MRLHLVLVWPTLGAHRVTHSGHVFHRTDGNPEQRSQLPKLTKLVVGPR